MRRRWFWPLIAFGSLIEGLAAAALAFAFANRDYAEPAAGWTSYVPIAGDDDSPSVGFSFHPGDCFTCVDPRPWLIAGLVLLVVGVVPYVLAVRAR